MNGEPPPNPGQFSYTWTAASRLGEALAAAEAEYGPRNTQFTILGCEFSEAGPGVWFPGWRAGRKHVVVQLGANSMLNEAEMLWQIAQEAIHLLDPAPGAANLLEEGVSIVFSRRHVQGRNQPIPSSISANYAEAARLVEDLEAERPGILRVLRERGKGWRNVTDGLIMELVPSFGAEKARRIVQDFA